MARITYGDKEPGDLFTADDADEIRTAVNALGTAADANTGTSAGNVPVIGAEGLLSASIIPGGGGGGGGGTGDVTGPGSVTDGRMALWDGTTGDLLKQAPAAQMWPVSGTNGYWGYYTSDAPSWAPLSTLVAALEALTTTDRIEYTGINGLDGVAAGALYETAIIGSTSATSLQAIRVDVAGTGLEGVTLGTAALLDAIPSGAPTAASSSAGAITLNYAGVAVLETTTTENITTITFSNITAYTTVLWRVKHTTARTITFPAGTKITTGVLAYVGSANSTVNILIYNDNGTYEVAIGDPLPVGA
jgi:hypothetical protein